MISIIFCTNRLDPKFDWFVDSLAAQSTQDDRSNIELIFIDSCNDSRFDLNEISRKELVRIAVDGRFKYRHSLPKPNIYQGENRKTKTEMFSPSNARNTGILLSDGDYLVFADDVAVLMPTWWGAVKEAAKLGRIVCGSYHKRFKMVVENGVLVDSGLNEMGRDSRWNIGSDQGPVQISGQSLFGCSLGIPAKDIIEVNGFDEICDSIGGEDYHLGIRLNNLGKRIYYDRRMFTVESEELHNQPYLMLREDRVLPQDHYMSRLRELGVKNRHHPGNWDSSHMILDLLYGLRQVKTLGNNYSIAADRPSKYFFPPADDAFHWFDRRPLNQI